MTGIYGAIGMRARMRAACMNVDAARPVLMLLKFSGDALISRVDELERAVSDQVHGMWIMDISRAMLLIVRYEQLDAPWLGALARRTQQAMETALSLTPAVLIQQADSVHAARDLWQTLEQQSELRLYAPGCVHIVNARNPEDDAGMLEQLDKLLGEVNSALDRKNGGEAYAHMQELVECMRLLGDASAPYMRYVAIGAMTAIMKRGGSRKSVKAILDQVLAAHSAEQMAALVETQMPLLIEDAPAAHEDAIDRILRRIHEDYGQELTLDSLAKSVYMTPSYVSYLFKQRTGTTLIKYITNHRLKRAAQMLVAGKRTVTEIAQRVGYDNTSYFSSLFKTRYGVSPVQYGKPHRAEDEKM